MSSLINTKIQDTYTGLIKTADNAPITATLKNLEDGNGGVLPIQVSTTGVNFTGNVTGIEAGGLASGTGTNSMASALTATPAIASNEETLAIGKGAQATNFFASAYGASAVASGSFAQAIGTYCEAGGAYGVALGTGCNASGEFALAVGKQSTAAGASAISIGIENTVDVIDAIAIGNNNNNSGQGNTIMIGKNWSHVFGQRCIFLGTNATVKTIGQDDVIAIGSITSGDSNGGIAIGNETQIHGASNGFGIAVGYQAKAGIDATTDLCIAIGKTSFASAAGSVALGANVTAAIADTVSIKELETQTVGGGITMYSPNGTGYKLTVSDAGAPVFTAI